MSDFTLFAEGDLVVWNESSEEQADGFLLQVYKHKYGDGPFRVTAVSEVPLINRSHFCHPQQLRIKGPSGLPVSQTWSGSWFKKAAVPAE